MENISQQIGALGIRTIAAIVALPLEILVKHFSYLPRDERLATYRRRQVKKKRQFNEGSTWKCIHIDIGDLSKFDTRTDRSKYLFKSVPYLKDTLIDVQKAGQIHSQPVTDIVPLSNIRDDDRYEIDKAFLVTARAFAEPSSVGR